MAHICLSLFKGVKQTMQIRAKLSRQTAARQPGAFGRGLSSEIDHVEALNLLAGGRDYIGGERRFG